MHMEYGLIAFDSTHDAIRVENIAKQQHYHARLIGTPGAITAGCGLSLRYELGDSDVLRKMLNADQVGYKGMYHVTRDGLKSEYDKIG